MDEIVIVGAARTALGSFMGSLSSLSAPRLAAVSIKSALERAGLSAEQVSESLWARCWPREKVRPRQATAAKLQIPGHVPEMKLIQAASASSV